MKSNSKQSVTLYDALVNNYHPECDMPVCCALDGHHTCYGKPGHYGVHSCGESHHNGCFIACRHTWANIVPEPELIDFERVI